MKILISVMAMVLVCGLNAAAQSDPGADLTAIRTSLLANDANTMHPDAWYRVMADLDSVISRAEESDNASLAVEATLLKAMALSDMRGEHAQAAMVLRGLIGRYGKSVTPGLATAYARLAETHAKTGDSQAIVELIEEFKGSANYDAQSYAASGGRGPSDPIRMVRPGHTAEASITVTSMEKALLQAKSAPGRRCPAFSAVDLEGVPVSSQDLDGSLVLIDFWSYRFPRWEQSLPDLVRIADRYRNAGFKVIGVPVDSEYMNSMSALGHAGANWPQLRPTADLFKAFGVYGEASNVLVDPAGRIIGSNLYGIELEAALRKSIEIR